MQVSSNWKRTLTIWTCFDVRRTQLVCKTSAIWLSRFDSYHVHNIPGKQKTGCIATSYIRVKRFGRGFSKTKTDCGCKSYKTVWNSSYIERVKLHVPGTLLDIKHRSDVLRYHKIKKKTVKQIFTYVFLEVYKGNGIPTVLKTVL